MPRFSDMLSKKAKEVKGFYKGELDETEVNILFGSPEEVGPIIKYYSELESTEEIAFDISKQFKEKQGYIFLVSLPTNMNWRNPENSPKKSSLIMGKDGFGIKQCRCRIKGKDEFFTPWVSEEDLKRIKEEYKEWKEEKSETPLQIFIYGNLNTKNQYYKMGDDDANGKKVILPEDKFLKRHGIDSLEDLDDGDWKLYKNYSTNAWEVLI